MKYDSTYDTLEHIYSVRDKIEKFISDLKLRGNLHDLSKLYYPEKEAFDRHTQALKDLEYGSPEYNESLILLDVALTHHYSNNSHHPQHYTGGVSDMSLMDIVEMLCDWKSYSERHSGGNIHKSIEINIERFGIDSQLASILKRTAIDLWPDG